MLRTGEKSVVHMKVLDSLTVLISVQHLSVASQDFLNSAGTSRTIPGVLISTAMLASLWTKAAPRYVTDGLHASDPIPYNLFRKTDTAAAARSGST
jgi:hypothetical protein